MILTTKTLYSFLDAFTFRQGQNKTINGIQLKLPSKHVRTTPTGTEKEDFSFLKSCLREGSTILDIGAQNGLFSVIAAKIAGSYGKIFAFESTPENFLSLKQTINLNQLDNFIIPFRKNLGSENADAGTPYSAGQSNNASTANRFMDFNTIDEFVFVQKTSKINFINVDVKAMEYNILLGGIKVLKRFKPYMIITIHPVLNNEKRYQAEQLYDLLDGMQYNILYRGAYMSREEFCTNTHTIKVHISPA